MSTLSYSSVGGSMCFGSFLFVGLFDGRKNESCWKVWRIGEEGGGWMDY